MRVLSKRNWSRKVVKQKALEASGDLRALYHSRVAKYTMDKLVFLDESASNERTGHRRHGWSPIGNDATALVKTKWFTRWSILPALTIRGYLPNPLIIHAGVTQMTFNWFVQNRVLPYLEPGMVIVLDNCAIHRDPLLRQMVEEAGLELVYLPPYSPDLNPIEQTFNVLKRWIKRHFYMAEGFSDFGAFLAYAVEHAIGDVEGHYRESGYSMDLVKVD